MMTSQRAKSAFAGTTCLLATCATASAADLGPYKPYSAPPPPPEVSYEAPAIWQGAYIGVNGGYGWSNNPIGADGAFGGGQLGYNWQRDRLVFGIEGDFQGADINKTTGVDTDIGSGVARSDLDWFSTVRGRVGLANGPFLLYATGGVAFANIDNRVDINPDITLHDSSVHTGYAVGGGVEWAFARNWTAKAEYLYLGFGDDKVSGSDSLGTPFSTKINNDIQTVRLGLNYKF